MKIDLALNDKLREERKMIMEQFIDVCRCLKINADMSKIMGLSGEEGVLYAVLVDRMYFEHEGVFWMNPVNIVLSVVGRC